jgi:cyclomaltodextrinase / maltogenic alpha-amylase / neopullulanase
VGSWIDYAIWWHVYPLGFTGAPAEAATVAARPRLRHLEGWLDYAVELGCSGLLLRPVFAAETHGYDTVDHFRIDPRLGTDDDFDRLIDAAGRRGPAVAATPEPEPGARPEPALVPAHSWTILAPATP